ncbi:MAG: hypothetical protein WCN98_07180 [Verrucomicrobiaceae bacterium]
MNRLMLVVRNLPGGQAQVKWGSATKQFSREQLENGINLADEFLDNPFSEPFARVKQLVHEKQNFENQMVLGVLNGFHGINGMFKVNETVDPDVKAALDTIRMKLTVRQREMATKAREAVKPVAHTIEITPL